MSTEITNGNMTRYCKPSKIDKKKKKPLPAAFELRKERDEKYLSVYLLEYFKNDSEKENVKSTRDYFLEELSWDFPKNSGFAVLNIESIKKRIEAYIDEEEDDYCSISFRERGLPHCGGFFSGNELTILKLLAQSSHALYFVKDL